MTWRTLLLLAAATLAAQTAAPTGSIEGRVFNARTGAPLRKATVRLAPLNMPGQQQPLAMVSDDEGRYQFTGLPAGRYQLSADRAGFLSQYYGVRRSNTPGAPIAFAANEHLTDADLRLLPQGVITGRVLDEDGDPVASSQIIVFKQAYSDGKKQWTQAGTVWTDDTGQYRISSLAPGRYLIESFNRRPLTSNHFGVDRDLADAPEMIYAPIYYPNVASEQAASPLEVSAGADLQGIDIHIFKSPAFRVRGLVAGVPPGGRGVSVALYSAGNAPTPAQDSAVDPPDYRFEIRGVLAGAYTVVANAAGGRSQLTVMQPLAVAGNITDLVLTVAPQLTLTGQVTVAESGSQVKLESTIVNLRSLVSGFQGGMPGGRADASGKLAFPLPYPAGHYAVSLQRIPEGCFLQKVKVGGQEVPADDVEISSSAPIEIILSAMAGSIVGTVVDHDGKPSPHVTVALIPSGIGDESQSTTSNDTGGFRFDGLRPATYQLFAWEDVESGAWQDPDFRKPYEGRATEVTVGPSETGNAQVRVIAADEMK